MAWLSANCRAICLLKAGICLFTHRCCDNAGVRRKMSRPISQFDAQIAAIARSTGAALATRNVNDFEGCEIELINPW